MKAAALEYARRGVHVFPLQPNDKIPFGGGHGCNDATTDPDTIERWWTAAPTGNVAIATGPSGFVVIDIDVKNGADGWDALDDCMKQLGQLPGPTRMVSTPSGGAHIYFRAPEGVTITNSAGRLKSGIETPGLDVRADGGYVVAPPSVIDGKVYHWDITAPAKMLPTAWAQAMLPPKPRYVAPENRPVIERASAYGVSVLNGEADTVAKAKRGQRNDTVTRSAFLVGTIADQCGIAGAQAEKVFAWAVGHWGDEAEARKAHGSFWRAFEAGRLQPRQLELRSA
jgi:hypothetical protein